ncbi:MAG: hypothetical protein JNM56_39620 [Planctomycetia bacterium]|nr:hypothetical protein [Planctomycetia bacterium]
MKIRRAAALAASRPGNPGMPVTARQARRIAFASVRTKKANGTAVYQRQYKRGLTMPQLNAIDLLAAGKADRETAGLLNLNLCAQWSRMA